MGAAPLHSGRALSPGAGYKAAVAPRTEQLSTFFVELADAFSTLDSTSKPSTFFFLKLILLHVQSRAPSACLRLLNLE